MFAKRSKFLLAGVAIVVVVSAILVSKMMEPIFAAPKGITTMKLFQDVASLDVEPFINDWLAAQSGIVVDSLDVDSAGAYQIAIGYHSAPVGSTTTRLRFFEPEEGGVQDVENAVNAFLNSLSSARDVRAIDVSQGTVRPIAVFILYD